MTSASQMFNILSSWNSQTPVSCSGLVFKQTYFCFGLKTDIFLARTHCNLAVQVYQFSAKPSSPGPCFACEWQLFSCWGRLLFLLIKNLMCQIHMNSHHVLTFLFFIHEIFVMYSSSPHRPPSPQSLALPCLQRLALFCSVLIRDLSLSLPPFCS